MSIVTSDFERQLHNYRLTTAQIFYHRPDYPKFLQDYTWQELDVAPRFPELFRFLKFWEKNLDGRLHSIIVASTELIKPAEFRIVDGLFQLQ